MKTASMLGIVCFVVAPVLAGPLPYPITMTSSTLTIDISPNGAADPDPIGPVNLSNTFSMTIYDNDASETASNSDTFVFDVGDMSNPTLQTRLISIVTATIPSGSLRFTDFDLVGPGHISGGASAIGASNYVETTIFTVGAYYTTFRATGWTSPTVSATFQTVGTTLFIDIQYSATFAEIPITEYSATLFLDYIVEIEATSFIPEPGLGSVVVLGLGSAGAWLRRRRR